jgi:hypothetical protein
LPMVGGAFRFSLQVQRGDFGTDGLESNGRASASKLHSGPGSAFAFLGDIHRA